MAERSVFRGGGVPNLGAYKRLAWIVGAVIVVLLIGSACVTRVDVGHVGVRVKLAGSARGAQDAPTVQGWVFYNPLTEQIVQFPTAVLNVVWSASPHEGKPVDESLTFSSSEGAQINADIGMAFHIDPQQAPKLYAKFKQTDMIAFADGYIRNTVREAFNEIASSMKVNEIYGPGKNKLIADVTKQVTERLRAEGIIVDQLTINGSLRLPENVVAQINAALAQQQMSIQALNRVEQVKAEAEQAITSAAGQAEAARQKAAGEADAILIRARAEAQANEIIRLSTTPAVLAYKQIEKWDGRLPMYTAGSSLPMATFDATKIPEISEADRQKLLDDALKKSAPATSASSSTLPTTAGSIAPPK